jgi:hypothetical protein
MDIIMGCFFAQPSSSDSRCYVGPRLLFFRASPRDRGQVVRERGQEQQEQRPEDRRAGASDAA